jgi:long-chain acyl-CoA synthetase
MEAAYAAQTLGAYSVPINWHFKAEEIGYILSDLRRPRARRPCRSTGADCGRPAGRDHANRRINASGGGERLRFSRRCRRARYSGAHDYETWLARQTPMRARC